LSGKGRSTVTVDATSTHKTANLFLLMIASPDREKFTIQARGFNRGYIIRCNVFNVTLLKTDR